ncbi:conserved exported hypothetical protein [Sphingomonas sp. EC-HK361]|uniref:I78 family peptidase inhibitor n=1 Tax=Sphingomonas sp. EC-HK361 TaxID=2038397 RepID=UPI001256C4FE|nr:I78 family peptidase inhibitor [Sphingomonas sp. EC-HK361]VVT03037.1 conserved exported hypothetical protein [Sphingomonas sp. EC-HK361]
MKALAALTPLALIGCAAATPAPEPMPGGVRCDASAIGDLIGKPADATLATEALRRSGARTIRWLHPDTAMTMDYRVDRLNVKMDLKNVVTGFTCG